MKASAASVKTKRREPVVAPSHPSAPAGTMSGFGNEFATEAHPGALPEGQNSPQRGNYGLYTEQLSGSAFTAPKQRNLRSWLYRMRPAVRHLGFFEPFPFPQWATAPLASSAAVAAVGPGPHRWDPTPLPQDDVTFIDGIRTLTAGGDAAMGSGFAVHSFAATQSMTDDYFCNADGELLIVAECGSFRLFTELGLLDLSPGEIAVIGRGMTFQVELFDDQPIRGYVCENYGAPFALPERGPIGANGLANARDFLTPVAAYEDRDGDSCRLILKSAGVFYATTLDHSPLDVVAWHGNYAPYKYDLHRFSPVGSILNDHPDPSIFTVLTSASDTPGTANIDFVWFGSRWLVAENSFRPPWFHRNTMSEFMGLIEGQYDAKPSGFEPGGFSLHNCMIAHGPDSEAFAAATASSLSPDKLDDTLAFMIETRFPQKLSAYAAALSTRQRDYVDVWQNLQRHFDPSRRDWIGN